MHAFLCVSVLVSSVLMGCVALAGAEIPYTTLRENESTGEVREKRSMPYWNMWTSDFVGWVEELRAQAGYDRIDDLARTFWAHFPIASYLGYDNLNTDPESNGSE